MFLNYLRAIHLPSLKSGVFLPLVKYKEVYYEVYKKARELGKNVMTAAELAGKEPAVLTGYKKYGPTRWKIWKRFSFEEMNKKIKHAKKVARDRY